MFQELRSSFRLVLIVVFFTGVVYPLTVTVLGQFLFPHQANGSLVIEDDRIIGSELIGQAFTDPKYFFSRPSAAGKGQGYDGRNSGGSNLAPSSDKLIERIEERVRLVREEGDRRLIPVDLVTASGSGLDPHISVASALYQAPRIARIRGLPLHQVENLISLYTAAHPLGIWGEMRVNVLALNKALDQLSFIPEPPAPSKTGAKAKKKPHATKQSSAQP